MSCKERNFELITDIVAYPDNAVTFVDPLQVFEKYLTGEKFSYNEDLAITVPLKPNSGKLEDSSKEGLQGTTYTVSLTWEVERVDASVYAILKDLKKPFKHLIITTFGGNRSLVRSNEDGWKFSFEESGGVVKCDLSVMNTSGIQRILE